METAVVTGAGRGIGLEIARRLASRGYGVLVTDVDQQAAERAAAELGAPAWAMGLDVRDPAGHRAAAAAAGERGPLRVWVNNAGVLRTQKAWEHDDDQVRLMVEANLLGVIWGSRAAVDAMRAGIDIATHSVCPDTVATDMVHERASDPDSAIIFSAPRLLTAAEVAERSVALLDSSKIVLVVPTWRGWVARSLAPFPRVGLRMLAAFRRSGERKRKKASVNA